MAYPAVSSSEAARSRLRATVATLERELWSLPRRVTGDDGRNPPSGLLASFRDLVAQLDLGPEPELRECPVCAHLGRRAATRCGTCWAALTPPAAG